MLPLPHLRPRFLLFRILAVCIVGLNGTFIRADYKCACKNTDVTCYQSNPSNPNMPLKGSAAYCADHCSSRGGVDSSASGPTSQCTEHIPYTHDVLVQYVFWTIWHQGAVTFAQPDQAQPLHGKDLKDVLVSTAGNSKEADGRSIKWEVYDSVAVMAEASDSEREQARMEAISKCKTTYPEPVVLEHLRYVAINKGFWGQLDFFRKTQRWDSIRTAFNTGENDVPNVKNLLACFSGPELSELVSKLGPLPSDYYQPHRPPSGQTIQERGGSRLEDVVCRACLMPVRPKKIDRSTSNH